MKSYKENYTIIFKLYSELYQPGSNEFSQVGHTASITSFKSPESTDFKIYFIDPQQELFQEVFTDGYFVNATIPTTLTAFLTTNYPYRYMDVIWIASNNNLNVPSMNKNTLMDYYNKLNGVHIIPLKQEVIFG